MVYLNKYQSPMGEITLASNGRELTGLWFEGQKYFAANLPEDCQEMELSIFDQARRWLDIYFTGTDPKFTPPLDIGQATPFRKRVMELMLEIPFGQTTTYGKIAMQIEKETGKKISARAVGGAVGRNSISIIIPCHRVMGANGKLTGYAGGIKRKIDLLKLEGLKNLSFSIND